MYGGRVTDDMDRRALVTYLNEYLGNFIFDKNQKFFFSKAGADYVIPDEPTFELTLQYIDEIDDLVSPGVFGLHSNAEIQYLTNSAKSLYKNILDMQTSEGGGAGGVSKEELINQFADEIEASNIPPLYDVYNIRKSFDVP